MTTSTILQIMSILIGVTGIGLSWYYKRENQKLKKSQKRRIWTHLSAIKSIMGDCERGLDQNLIWRKLGLTFRMLLAEATMIEDNFSIKTISLWRKTGKLSSQWQEHLALQLLDTDEIKEEDAEKLEEEFSNWDATPHNHQYRPNHPKHFNFMNKDQKQVEIDEKLKMKRKERIKEGWL